ncbi:MAG: hypothetical protein KGH88_09500, partial [Thaumarchaeota archaeon]|nr:hypothetical protein [Nitrososphaerota archaeon]
MIKTRHDKIDFDLDIERIIPDTKIARPNMPYNIGSSKSGYGQLLPGLLHTNPFLVSSKYFSDNSKFAVKCT